MEALSVSDKTLAMPFALMGLDTIMVDMLSPFIRLNAFAIVLFPEPLRPYTRESFVSFPSVESKMGSSVSEMKFAPCIFIDDISLSILVVFFVWMILFIMQEEKKNYCGTQRNLMVTGIDTASFIPLPQCPLPLCPHEDTDTLQKRREAPLVDDVRNVRHPLTQV